MAMLVVAIDFGTTFSGYGYSYKWEKEKVYTHTWVSNSNVQSPKTPTALLLDENHKFVAFGYEAQQKYTKLKKSGFGSKSYYFDCFKMQLYDKDIHTDLCITSVDGRSVPAITVFSESLRFLKNHFFEKLKEQGKKFVESDIQWVLTVPAIWTDPAKQFMKKAAVQAGLVTEETFNQLTIALEPEAASVWCKTMPCGTYTGSSKSGKALETEIGAKYLVVDCGGGTIDITLHEIIGEGKIKEIAKASGGGWGGTMVDKEFMKIFTNAIGEKVMQEYQDKHPEEYIQMKTELQFSKTTIKTMECELQIQLKYLLIETMKEQTGKRVSEVLDSKIGVRFVAGHIQFDADVVRRCFDPAVQNTYEFIRKLLKTTHDVKYIVLVGGFANSPFIRHVVEKAARFNGANVFTPDEPETIVIKGAVLYGQDPKVMTERVSAATYGIRMHNYFDSSIHPEEKKLLRNGEEMCDNIFQKLVEEGETFKIGEEKTFHYLSDSRSLSFQFYMTKRRDVMFVDESDVCKIFSYVLNDILSDSEDGKDLYLTIALDSSINITVRVGESSQIKMGNLELITK